MNPWVKDFPQIHKNYHYFDSAATSLKPQSVIDGVSDYYGRLSSNIHRGMYRQSQEATELYEATREKIASWINASPREIVFTRGTTSALNLVARSYGLSHLSEDDEILTTELEHHSSILPWQHVSHQTKAQLRFIDLSDDGKVTIEAFKKAMNEKTKVVAIHHVSNVLGYKIPIKAMTEIAHQYGAIVVVDGAQAIQHMTIDVKDLGVDFYAFSGHKMLGPTGIGVLYGRFDLLDQMQPIEFGGDMALDVMKYQFSWKETPIKFESGTMPIAEVLGLSKAIDYIQNIGFDQMHAHSKALYDSLYNALSKMEGIELYNHDSDTFIFTFNLTNVPAHDAITFYAEKNIALRAGQHCAKLVHDFLGIHASLRGTIYFYNTEEDIQYLIETTKEAIEYFKSLGF